MLYLVSWVMILKLSKKVYFLQFCADLGQKPKSVKAIYMYISEKYLYRLSENVLVYGSLSHRSWGISNYNIKKDADSAEIYQNSSISNTNIFKTLSHSIINNTIFWKRLTKPFRCIYVNCFNIFNCIKLLFFLRSQHKIEKMHFFRQFKDHNSGKENENYKNNPIFWSNVSVLPACNIHFWWSILVCKIPQFLPKATDLESSSYFSRK